MGKFQKLVLEGSKLKGGFATLSDSQLLKIRGGSGECGCGSNNCQCGSCHCNNCQCQGNNCQC